MEICNLIDNLVTPFGDYLFAVCRSIIACYNLIVKSLKKIMSPKYPEDIRYLKA